jgi:DnaJ-class molecular chaperone
MRKIMVSCPECLGSGTASGGSPSCRRCAGTGEVQDFDLFISAPRRESSAADVLRQASGGRGRDSST